MNKKNINILIPNATSPKNIGDLAILNGLIRLINKSIPTAEVVIHSTEPDLYEDKFASKINHTVYSWVAFENRSPVVRMVHLFQLFFAYSQIKLKINLFPTNSELESLINDFRNADIVIFVGGGYLRTKKRITQSINLLMQLFIFRMAKALEKNIIVAPISFGPFAYKWQENISANTLSGLDLIAAREEISFKLLNKHLIEHVILSSDHALLLKPKTNKENKSKELKIGFTIRNWLKEEKQLEFEDSFVKGISEALNDRTIIQPIVQVNSPEFGEDDYEITNRVAEKLKLLGCNVYEIHLIKSLNDANKIYSSIDLLIGMRMHSNILAAINNTPFVAISYEHKTSGISKDLGMEEYCIDCEKVTEEKLFNLLTKVIKNKKLLEKKLEKSLDEIRSREFEKWQNILTPYSKNIQR